MNQLGQNQPREQPRVEQPGVYNIILNVTSTQGIQDSTFEIKVNPDIPFNIFAENALKVVFAQEMPKFYDEKIIFMLDEQLFQKTETRTLRNLGFKQNSILKIKLNLKGG